MFIEFFYMLKAKGLDVSMTEWLTLMDALDKGLIESNFSNFYYISRMILVKSEADYDKFDLAFMEFFAVFFMVWRVKTEIVHSQILSFDLGINFSGSLQNFLHIKIPFTIYHPSILYKYRFFKKLKHLDIP